MQPSNEAEHLSSFQRFSSGSDTRGGGFGGCSPARRTIACSWTLLNWVWFRAAIMSLTCSTYLQNRVYRIICSHKLFSIRISLPLKHYSYYFDSYKSQNRSACKALYQEWTSYALYTGHAHPLMWHSAVVT